jgi:hypothetical protein
VALGTGKGMTWERWRFPSAHGPHRIRSTKEDMVIRSPVLPPMQPLSEYGNRIAFLTKFCFGTQICNIHLDRTPISFSIFAGRLAFLPKWIILKIIFIYIYLSTYLSILFNSILSYSILFCSTLFYSVLLYFTLFYSFLIRFYSTLFHSILFYFILIYFYPIYLSICLSVYLSIYRSIDLSIYRSFYLAIYRSMYLF